MLTETLLWILAQAPTAGPTTSPVRPWWANLIANPMFLLLPLVLLFLFMSSRTKRRQETERKNLLESLKRNTEVETIGGMIGRVMETRDDQVLLKVDEGSNTKIWFRRSAIHRVRDKDADKSEAK